MISQSSLKVGTGNKAVVKQTNLNSQSLQLRDFDINSTLPQDYFENIKLHLKNNYSNIVTINILAQLLL